MLHFDCPIILNPGNRVSVTRYRDSVLEADLADLFRYGSFTF